jgi:hypothetical protein
MSWRDKHTVVFVSSAFFIDLLLLPLCLVMGIIVDAIVHEVRKGGKPGTS